MGGRGEVPPGQAQAQAQAHWQRRLALMRAGTSFLGAVRAPLGPLQRSALHDAAAAGDSALVTGLLALPQVQSDGTDGAGLTPCVH